jgi:hypothetical protein
MAAALRWQDPKLGPPRNGLSTWAVVAHALALSAGLVAVAGGMRLAADDRTPTGSLLFWLGLALIFLPLAWRALTPSSPWPVVLGSLMVLVLGLYLVKVLRTPGLLTFHDEFMHWRTAKDLADGGGLSASNPLNPPSARYPGLELVTNAMANATGLSLSSSGMVIIALAKVGLVTALALTLRMVGGSPRGAALGCLAYLGNPLFLFWSSQFAYESIAVPFAVLCLMATMTAAATQRPPAWATAVAVTSGAAVVVTHHLTSWLLAVTLLVTAAWLWIGRRSDPRVAPRPFLISGVLVGGGAALWLVTVAWSAIDYVSPPIRRGFSDLVNVLLGDSSSRRQLFASPGTTPPFWERAVAVIGVAIVTVAVVVAAVRLIRRRPVGRLVAGGAIVALLYPASVGLRFAQGGQELANRIGALLFLAVAVSAAVGLPVPARRRWRAVMVLGLAVVFTSGVVTGFARYARLPGSYLVSAGPRSVDPSALQATSWIHAAYGPGRRLAATSTQALLLGSYGQEHPLSAIDAANMSPLFFGAVLGPAQRALVRAQRVDLVVPDLRVTQQPPQDKSFVEPGEPGDGQHVRPLPAAYIAKYDRAPDVERRFDNGDIRVYDVRRVQR